MAFGIAELIILGLISELIARKLKLPGLIGLLILGVLLGPYLLNLINPQTKAVASDLRLIALIVILLRAGLEISKETLIKIGPRAALMSFIPCLAEISMITIIAPHVLELSYLESAILGSVLAAVSPAVVVPLMINFIKQGRGSKKGIPTLVLAGASIDDAIAIVLCSSFLGIYVGKSVNIFKNIISIPISIFIGITIGLIIGTVLYKLFKYFNPRATKKVLIIMGISIITIQFQTNIEKLIPFAALIAVMTIGFILLEKNEKIAHEISSKLGKIWVLAQLLLFTLVGTQVNLPLAINAGLAGLIIITAGLLARSFGVQLCLIKSNLNKKERAFVAISYLPKATVQAAIGATPLLVMQTNRLNTAPGELILAIAVLSIIVTAPLGAILISWSGPKFLEQTKQHSPQETAAIEST